MVNFVLLIGRIVLVALLYVFLFAVMRTGVGLVKGQRKAQESWTVTVAHGPRTLRGVKIHVAGPVIVGRAPGADILIPTDYVSGRHARFSLMGTGLMIEDLGSTNGTLLNGKPVTSMTACATGDTVTVGDVDIKIGRS